MEYIEIKVLGGLRITVAPDTAAGDEYGWYIVEIGGKPVRGSCEWLLRRLRETGDDRRVDEAVVFASEAW